MTLPWRHWYHCTVHTYGSWLPGDDRGHRTRGHVEHIEGDYDQPPPAGQRAGLREHADQAMPRPPVMLTHDERRLACLRFTEAMLFHGAELIELAVSATHLHALARFCSHGGAGVGVPAPESQPREGLGFTGGESPPAPAGGAAASGGSPVVRLASSTDELRGFLLPGRNPPSLTAEQLLRDGRDALPRNVLGKAKSWTSLKLRLSGMVPGTGGVFAIRSKLTPIADFAHQLNVARYIEGHRDEGAAVLTLLLEAGEVIPG